MFIKPLLLSVSFLTRLPVPSINNINDKDIARSLLCYPLTGALIGLLLYAGLMVLPNETIKHAAQPLAAIITVLWVMITGALHLDGLADSADAWLGGLGNPEKTHKIIKDPLVGAAGVTAIACLLLLKYAALSAIIASGQIWLIIVAPIIGRNSVLLLFLTTPYVRKQGLGNALVDQLDKKTTAIVFVFVLLSVSYLSLYAVVATLIVFWLLRRLMMQRLEGCTGDTAGAGIEITEATWLLAVALSL